MVLADGFVETAPETWTESSEALDGYLGNSEVIQVTLGALVRVGLQFLDRCELVLTDRQLILLKPSWPWGFRFEQAIAREDCRVSKFTPRVDGSQLLVLSGPGQDMCFYVPRRSSDVGRAVMEALS